MVAAGVYFIHLLLVVYTFYTINYKCCDHCSWEVDSDNEQDDEANIPDLEAGAPVQLETGGSEEIKELANQAISRKREEIKELANQAISRKRVPNYRGESSSCIREILKD